MNNQIILKLRMLYSSFLLLFCVSASPISGMAYAPLLEKAVEAKLLAKKYAEYIHVFYENQLKQYGISVVKKDYTLYFTGNQCFVSFNGKQCHAVQPELAAKSMTTDELDYFEKLVSQLEKLKSTSLVTKAINKGIELFIKTAKLRNISYLIQSQMRSFLGDLSPSAQGFLPYLNNMRKLFPSRKEITEVSVDLDFVTQFKKIELTSAQGDIKEIPIDFYEKIEALYTHPQFASGRSIFEYQRSTFIHRCLLILEQVNKNQNVDLSSLQNYFYLSCIDHHGSLINLSVFSCYLNWLVSKFISAVNQIFLSQSPVTVKAATLANEFSEFVKKISNKTEHNDLMWHLSQKGISGFEHMEVEAPYNQNQKPALLEVSAEHAWNYYKKLNYSLKNKVSVQDILDHVDLSPEERTLLESLTTEHGAGALIVLEELLLIVPRIIPYVVSWFTQESAVHFGFALGQKQSAYQAMQELNNPDKLPSGLGSASQHEITNSPTESHVYPGSKTTPTLADQLHGPNLGSGTGVPQNWKVILQDLQNEIRSPEKAAAQVRAIPIAKKRFDESLSNLTEELKSIVKIGNISCQLQMKPFRKFCLDPLMSYSLKVDKFLNSALRTLYSQFEGIMSDKEGEFIGINSTIAQDKALCCIHSFYQKMGLNLNQQEFAQLLGIKRSVNHIFEGARSIKGLFTADGAKYRSALDSTRLSITPDNDFTTELRTVDSLCKSGNIEQARAIKNSKQVGSKAYTYMTQIISNYDLENSLKVPQVKQLSQHEIVLQEIFSEQEAHDFLAMCDQLIKKVPNVSEQASQSEEQQALQEYEKIESDSHDIEKINKNYGLPVGPLGKIKKHLFILKHLTSRGTYEKFAPLIGASEAWNRFCKGKATPLDILLLKHEFLELKLMERGLSSSEAHRIANQFYNWEKVAIPSLQSQIKETITLLNQHPSVQLFQKQKAQLMQVARKVNASKQEVYPDVITKETISCVAKQINVPQSLPSRIYRYMAKNSVTPEAIQHWHHLASGIFCESDINWFEHQLYQSIIYDAKLFNNQAEGLIEECNVAQDKTNPKPGPCIVGPEKESTPICTHVGPPKEYPSCGTGKIPESIPQDVCKHPDIKKPDAKLCNNNPVKEKIGTTFPEPPSLGPNNSKDSNIISMATPVDSGKEKLAPPVIVPGKHGKYRDIDYHTPKGNAWKSARPIDGQKALDNSVLVKKKPTGLTARVGISHGQFVVLPEDQPGIFHGHVRPWEKLEDEMQKALRKNGFVKGNKAKIVRDNA